MPMTMVDIGVMGMGVCDGRMEVAMRVRLLPVPCESVVVLMVRVVDMRMRMLERLVPVLVGMALRHVQPDSERHQRSSDRQ